MGVRIRSSAGDVPWSHQASSVFPGLIAMGDHALLVQDPAPILVTPQVRASRADSVVASPNRSTPQQQLAAQGLVADSVARRGFGSPGPTTLAQ